MCADPWKQQNLKMRLTWFMTERKGDRRWMDLAHNCEKMCSGLWLRVLLPMYALGDTSGGGHEDDKFDYMSCT